jgi:iron complex outermembrane receptor protein
MSYGYGAFNMNDVSFIEVLKGPQGTLFGKNAQSGVINIFTKPPSQSFESEVSIDMAEHNQKNIYARVSGPIKNTGLSYTLSITSDTSDGFTKNTATNSPFDTRDLKSFSSKIEYKINDQKNIKINYTKIKIDDGGSPFKLNTKDDPFNVNTEPINDTTQMNNDLLSAIFTNKDNKYKFTSVSTYASQDMQKKDYVGILGGLLLNYNIQIKEFSQELKLNYDQDKYDFMSGIFYSKKYKFDYDETQELQSISLTSTNDISNTDENKAVFFQGRYWLNNHYTVSLGARYQRIIRDFEKDLSLFNSTNHKGSDTTTWNHFTPMVSLNYYKNTYNIYLTYTQGYRPGGYNYREETSSLVPFKEEETNSYEIGYKNSQKKYTFENAIFYNDIKNHRINTLDDNLATHTYNAPKAYSYGFESKVSYKAKDISLFSTLGITRAKIKQFDTNTSMESKNLIDIPQSTASLGLKYNIDKNYYFQTNLKHMGKRYYNLDNSKYLSAYTTTNIETGYKNKNINISLYVNNLFDKEYNDFMIATPSNSYYHFGKPRFFGMRLNKRF